MSDPIIDKSLLNQTVNMTRRPALAVPGNGAIRFIGLHETENRSFRRGAAGVLNWNMVADPAHPGARGAANWYVDYPTGKLYHFVLEDTHIAWHAGASRFRDVSGADPVLKVARLSIVSIGVEVDLPGDGTPPSPPQWAALCWLVTHLAAYWRIPLDTDHLWEHKAVALPPGRKRDPESYSVQQLLAAIHQQGKP